jgi:3-oxoacyl-[acyl-carrier protein] reductase
MQRLKDKVALVTGASRGIGKATALAFALEGASVCLNFSQSREKADALVKEIEESKGTAIAYQANVANREEVARMVSTVLKEFGHIDILVNNAGIVIPGDLFSMSDDQLLEMYRVNVMGVVNCTTLVAKNMMDRKYGKIVNIGSIAGIGTNYLGTTPYSSTKASVMMLTKRFALELGSFGINVNSVAPGFIETELNSRGKSQEEWRKKVAEMSEKAMLRKIGQPEDIASAVLFLASDESSFITGQTLVVDGGRLDYLSHSL